MSESTRIDGDAPGPHAPIGSVTFVIPSLHGGGAEFVARTWMGWLADRGWVVSAILTGSDVDPAFAPDGVEIRSIAQHTGQGAKVMALRRALIELQTEVAVAMQSHPNLLLLAAARTIPPRRRPRVLISERNLVSLGLRGSRFAHRSKIWFTKRLYRWADHMIAISHPVAGEMVAAFGVNGDRISVVPNPAAAKVGSRTRVRHRPGSDQGLQLVLACRMVQQKRPLRAIGVAVELQHRGIDVEIVSFGGGPLLSSMTKGAEDAGVRFVHHGWVENWFEYFSPNAVVLLPSDREGFGNVLVEAAAAGFPSVALSAALGVADAVIPGITGDLASSARPADMADAVLRACELRVEGIDGWLQRFSVDASGSQLERLLVAVRTRVAA